ncbi:MAG: hypothetical protein HQK52_15750 [Oligoflexia bacterium]|nr:hypothetical protein [Oligoflexia bacterium]
MSEIDSFNHKCIGFIKCDFDRLFLPCADGKETAIPIYILKEDVEFGLKGDIVVGDGDGGVPMLRISTEKAIKLFTSDWDDFNDFKEIYQTYWSANATYVLCDGFKRLGWSPDFTIEKWITHHVISFLKKEYFDDYKEHFGKEELLCDGSICRLPMDDEEFEL